jgi:hypothetical protein
MLFRRAAALAVMLALAVAGSAECSGWQATPEARMACCTGRGRCPMHPADESGRRPARVVTQAQADSCCAASNTDGSTSSTVTFPLSLSAALAAGTTAILTPAMPPAPSFDAWRTHVPLPLGHVPKHVLLSVYLL